MADTNLIHMSTTTPNGVIVPANNNNHHHHNNGIVTTNKLTTMAKKREPTDPPDGGARAIVVMISAFLCNSILFGIINTYGTVYLTLHQNLENDGDAEASSKAGRFDYAIVLRGAGGRVCVVANRFVLIETRRLLCVCWFCFFF